MKTTIDYLDEVKEKHGLILDRELAKYLRLTTTAIGHYRKRKSTMDDYTALKVAVTLGIDPMEVIATANAERTKRPELKAVWKKIAAHGNRSKPMPPIPGTVYKTEEIPNFLVTVKKVIPIEYTDGGFDIILDTSEDGHTHHKPIEMDGWLWAAMVDRLKLTPYFSLCSK